MIFCVRFDSTQQFSVFSFRSNLYVYFLTSKYFFSGVVPIACIKSWLGKDSLEIVAENANKRGFPKAFGELASTVQTVIKNIREINENPLLLMREEKHIELLSHIHNENTKDAMSEHVARNIPENETRTKLIMHSLLSKIHNKKSKDAMSKNVERKIPETEKRTKMITRSSQITETKLPIPIATRNIAETENRTRMITRSSQISEKKLPIPIATRCKKTTERNTTKKNQAEMITPIIRRSERIRKMNRGS